MTTAGGGAQPAAPASTRAAHETSVNFAVDTDGRPIFPKEDIFDKFSAMYLKDCYLQGIPMLFLMAFCRGGQLRQIQDNATRAE